MQKSLVNRLENFNTLFKKNLTELYEWQSHLWPYDATYYQNLIQSWPEWNGYCDCSHCLQEMPEQHILPFLHQLYKTLDMAFFTAILTSQEKPYCLPPGFLEDYKANLQKVLLSDKVDTESLKSSLQPWNDIVPTIIVSFGLLMADFIMLFRQADQVFGEKYPEIQKAHKKIESFCKNFLSE